MKLITIAYSHCCEKARWGLDRARLPYVEKGYAPVIHRLAVVPLSERLSDGRLYLAGERFTAADLRVAA
jgi:glutathione S-transferase